jgi:hypothetical protein
MPLISTYSVVGFENSTLSRYYSSIDELLIPLLDNTNNSINAINVRDAVYTLYEYTNAIVASSSATSSLVYDRTNPSTFQSNVGGVLPGSTFSGSIQDALDRVFYPYVVPNRTISSLNIREFGYLQNGNATYSITTFSEPIQGFITFTSFPIGTSISPSAVVPINTVGVQNGTFTFSPTHSWNSSSITETNTFSFVIQDTVNTYTTSTQLTFMNKIYWGRVNLSSIGNPNLTYNPGSASLVGSICTDVIVKNLTGAGVTPGYQLTTNKNKTYTDINGNGWYLIFAWPSILPGANSPIFTVNGSPNTAFTRVRTNSPFVGLNGFTTNYEVWVSNTLQNSPLNIVIS